MRDRLTAASIMIIASLLLGAYLLAGALGFLK
jgi:hypothetical protein